MNTLDISIIFLSYFHRDNKKWKPKRGSFAVFIRQVLFNFCDACEKHQICFTIIAL